MVGCALAFALKVRGLRVGVMKPAETGCIQDADGLQPADALALHASASSSRPLVMLGSSSLMKCVKTPPHTLARQVSAATNMPHCIMS